MPLRYSAFAWHRSSFAARRGGCFLVERLHVQIIVGASAWPWRRRGGIQCVGVCIVDLDGERILLPEFIHATARLTAAVDVVELGHPLRAPTGSLMRHVFKTVAKIERSLFAPSPATDRGRVVHEVHSFDRRVCR